MLLTIARKEILANLLSFRFVVSFLLCMVLIPVSVYVLREDYKQELSNYNSRIMTFQEQLRTVGSIDKPFCDKGPAVLSVMFRKGGANRRLEGRMESPASGKFRFRTDTSDPIATLLPLFDMGTIMGVILSLMAILFGYDALVSEREGGTLKLMLSNSVSRSQVLMGKWIGGYISLLLPLAIPVIVSLLIVLIDPMVDLHGSDWFALGLIFLGAMIYISTFFGLAYFISALSRSFAASALISLCVWLFIVLVVPNISIYTASKLLPMPSMREVQRKQHQIDQERWRKTRGAMTEFMSKEHSKEEEAQFLEGALADDGFFAVNIWDAFREGRKVEAPFEQQASKQVNLAQQISMISPYICFIYLANTLSGTGVEAERHLTREGDVYLNEWGQYLIEKLRQNPRSLVGINRKMELHDMPMFEYVEQSVSERLSVSLKYFLLLAIFNVVFFMAAYLAFLRSGVR